MNDLWDRLNALFAKYYPVHSSKISYMAIREYKSVIVVFKGSKTDTPAVCFKVLNNTAGSNRLHNVLIAKHPVEKVLTMWCGDRSVVMKDGEKASQCEFWKKFKINGEEQGYACKHIVFVLRDLKKKERKEIEQMLGIGQLSVPTNINAISTALNLNKNIFIYGPTGSGKTHLVREHLKKTSHFEVHRIHITDGLEDIDLLQKLIPNPNGQGWQRLDGELIKAFRSAQHKKVVVLLEELTRSPRSLRNLLIKALDNEDGYYHLHDITTGDWISIPASNMIFIATANLAYQDTSSLDPSLARRFNLCVFQDYNETEEKKILENKVEKSIAEKIIKTAVWIRTQYKQGRFPYPLDTGSLIQWAELIASGINIKEAAELSWIFRVVEKDQLGYPEIGQVSAILEEL